MPCLGLLAVMLLAAAPRLSATQPTTGGPLLATGAAGSWAELSAAAQQATAGGSGLATVRLAAGAIEVPAGQSLSLSIMLSQSLRLVGAGPGRTVLRCAPKPASEEEGGVGAEPEAAATPAIFDVRSAGAFALDSLSVLDCARPILVRGHWGRLGADGVGWGKWELVAWQYARAARAVPPELAWHSAPSPALLHAAACASRGRNQLAPRPSTFDGVPGRPLTACPAARWRCTRCPSRAASPAKRPRSSSPRALPPQT
jgi:hypothetical protein